MAVISFNVPDVDLPRLINAFSVGYSPFLPDGVTPNPLTRAQTARQNLVNYLISTIQSYETYQAIQAASATAVQGITPIDVT